MRPLIVPAVCLLVALAPLASAAGDPESEEAAPAPPPGLKLENLMRQVLEGVENTEVIVSRVTIPPHTSLPKHWHPGEEFAYLMEGSLTLWQEGKDNVPLQAGDAGVVPLEQVHTATTGEKGAKLIVLRVHRVGEPERVLVE